MGEPVPRASTDCEATALAAILEGRRDDALELMMREYGRAIYRYCRRMLGDATNAEDVHQTVFLQAYRDLDRFASRSSLRSWLYGIAAHRCLDALKGSRRRERRLAPLDGVEDCAVDDIDAEERVLRAQLGRALESCLDELAAPARHAVLLRYVEGFTYQEMAVTCDQRPATLQARVARALPVLRRCLERSGIGP